MTEQNYAKEWSEKASKLLVGRTIRSVRYLTEEEQKDLYWSSKAIVLFLDNGTCVFPSRDDEGNDAGALFTTDNNLPTIPVV